MEQGLDYQRDVLPRLTAEAVYSGSIEWASQRGRYWLGRCPFHDDRDPRSRRFSVDTQTLGWRCFSCGRKGDAIRFVNGGQQPTGAAFGQAVQELARRAGVIDTGAYRPAEKRPNRDRPRRQAPRPDAKALALWAASQAAGTASPAARYLARRFVWPLEEMPVPTDVRRIAAADVRRILAWPPDRLPGDGWSGCLAVGFRTPGGDLGAVKLEALTANGRPCHPRWRRNAGRTAGLRFTACDLPGESVHVGEGEITALALAVQCKARGAGMAVSFGGDAGMKNATADLLPDDGRSAVIHADRDPAGRDAAWKLQDTLRSAGRSAETAGLRETERDKMDAAEALSYAVRERTAIQELDGNLDAAEAERAAWRGVLAMLRELELEL